VEVKRKRNKSKITNFHFPILGYAPNPVLFYRNSRQHLHGVFIQEHSLPPVKGFLAYIKNIWL